MQGPSARETVQRNDGRGGAQRRAKLQAKTLALAGIIGPVGFTTLVIVQGLLLPDYSHVRMPISALAAWPTGWIQVLNFCVSGVLIVAFAFGLNTGVQPTRRGATGAALLVAGGLGIIGAGVFSWKMIDGVPTETPAHAAAAILSFAATGLGLIIFSRRMNADVRWRDLSTFTMIAGIVVLVLFVTVGFFAIDDGAPLHPWAGLIQRILCAVWFTCLVVMARRLRSLELEMAVRGVHVSS
jgi:hypothetical membrane protein